MTINKIDENTMECVLTPEDLKNRGLSLDTATYTSPVMRSLIHDLAIFLAKKYSFGSKESPAVAVDAIPLSDGSLTMIFSTDSASDECDPRYSNFAEPDQSVANEAAGSESSSKNDLGYTLDDLLNTILASNSSEPEDRFILHHSADEECGKSWSESIFEFENISDALKVLHTLDGSLNIYVSLYLSPSGTCIVPVSFLKFSDEDIRKVFDIFCEFGDPREISSGTLFYIREHCKLLISFAMLSVLKVYL
ncbi:MAG: hypothetical protein DUD27_08105 [Lachnospiraceae bacterium]|uniref:Adaptor protein MecA n=1 Tax=Candidatus Weimeria bifida TaxID=2599074 RepID=A0A6N7J025_9FIRM|nr:adaptor protein MecA [Candidatus Weimeria bifida]RRF95275.1 MAG: hypothetical protein DUD27_08105 [Lachnospiraceae bacterium]